MAQDLPFSCDCGAVKARLRHIKPGHGTRITCHCRDCQAFIYYLGRETTALDPHHGMEVFQTRPSRFEILDGTDHLAAIHMTDKPTLRWYTSCCKTPLGTTLARGNFPFLGLVTYGLENNARDLALGPSKGHVHLKEADAEQSGLKRAALPLVGAAIFTRVLRAKLAGKKEKNPFFTPENGAPITEPYRLPKDARRGLDEKIEMG